MEPGRIALGKIVDLLWKSCRRPRRPDGTMRLAMNEFRTRRRVEFADTDMAGICHFARFFIFMETAEHELLASLGTCVITEEDGQRICWPRVAASCEYLSPARFGDELDIRVRVIRKGRTSLTYAHEITLRGAPVARGQVTTVCCVMSPDGSVRPIPVPAALAETIEEAP